MRWVKCWINFILTEGNTPGVVEAVNSSGGIAKGSRHEFWDCEGNFYGIRNLAGNAVWCHKKNLKVLSKGTLPGFHDSVPSVKDWQSLKRI